MYFCYSIRIYLNSKGMCDSGYAFVIMSTVIAGFTNSFSALRTHRFRVMLPSATQSRLFAVRGALPMVCRQSLTIALKSVLLSILVWLCFAPLVQAITSPGTAGWSRLPSFAAILLAAITSASAVLVIQLSMSIVRITYSLPATLASAQTADVARLIAAALIGDDALIKVHI